MSNRLLLLFLALMDGFAALPMFTHGLEWLAVLFLFTSCYLMVGIDRNDQRRDHDLDREHQRRGLGYWWSH